MDDVKVSGPAPGGHPPDLRLEWDCVPSQMLNLLPYTCLSVFALAALFGAIMVRTYMAEQSLGTVFFWGLVACVGIAAAWAFCRYLKYRLIHYRVAKGNLEISTGLLVRRTEMIELYRIRDIALRRPLHLRLIGLGHLTVLSSDRTAPETALLGIRDPRRIAALLREEVERARIRARVVGLESDASVDPTVEATGDG